ncbi:MAG: glycosyltransferase family 9 protein [Aggregatilineales bacterium]
MTPTGPLHLAVACGTPTVHLYGPTDPSEFGPWGDPNRHVVLTSAISCRPCRILDWPDTDAANHPCVRDIPPRAVIEAVLRAAES